jgi:hypothetical protein
MKFPKGDFPLIRTAVILLVTAIALSTAGIGGSMYLAESMQKGKSDDQKRLADTRAKLNLVREEEQQVRLYHAKYLELIKQGLLDKENRLEWIESFAAAKENRKLFGLDYQIDAQQPVQADAALAQGNLALYGSTMKLVFSLLHEEDLFNALNDLTRKNKGLSLLRECTVTRAEKDSGIGVSPHLKAECTLVVLTLKSKGGGDAQ